MPCEPLLAKTLQQNLYSTLLGRKWVSPEKSDLLRDRILLQVFQSSAKTSSMAFFTSGTT